MTVSTFRDSSSRARRAVTLVDAMVAILLFGIICAAVVAGIVQGLFTLRMARENSRATQILLEKVETIRLYTWDQISSNGYIPAHFYSFYDPEGAPNVGLTYTGRLMISTAPIPAAGYTNDLKLITVQLDWTTGGLLRQREFSTYFSRYGFYTYVN